MNRRIARKIWWSHRWPSYRGATLERAKQRFLSDAGLTVRKSDMYEERPCPQCGCLTLYTGYGLMGGGFGLYEGCDAPGCEYWKKGQDPDV